MEISHAIKTKSISIEVPENADHLGFNQSYFQEAVAALLYDNGTLTLKEARLLIGKSRYEFETEVLPKFGFTTMGHDPQNVEIELNASKW